MYNVVGPSQIKIEISKNLKSIIYMQNTQLTQ